MLLFVTGTCFTLWTSNANSILQLQRARPPARPRRQPLSLGFAGFAPLGGLLAGWLCEIGGTQLTFAVAGVTGLRDGSMFARPRRVLHRPNLPEHDTVTIRGHNARMTRRTVGKRLWAVAALLLVNAVLLAAQPGLALPGSLGSLLLRAQARARRGRACRTAASCTSTGSTAACIRVEAEHGTLTLRERDGSLVTIAVAPTPSITLGGRPVPLNALRRGHGRRR